MFLLFTLILLISRAVADDPTIADFLDKVNNTFSSGEYSVGQASWEYQTNLTKENQQAAEKKELEWNQMTLNFVQSATQLNITNASPDQRRQLLILRLSGGVPFNTEQQKNLSAVSSEMQEIYSTGKYNGMPLDPDLEHIMAQSRDYQQLLSTWKGWRDAVGPKIRKFFPQYVQLLNQGAKDSQFNDTGALWKSGYDMEPAAFEKLVDQAWTSIRPLYEQLHCYVRSKLMLKYGADKFPDEGYIPAHLLGNMWAQSWENIGDLVEPFPNATRVNVTPALLEQGYDAVRIHKLSEDFYRSLGYDPLPTTFWEKSMLTRPEGREVVCHASAWDFGNNDLRIKMCTKITQEDMLVVHHEQGHLYYDHYYRNLTFLYRSGANDGFHEAIGDTIQLSTLVPWHLQQVGLLKEANASYEQLINFQMSVALQKIAFLPFGLLIDKWRWAVFQGKVTDKDYNSEWWNLRQQYQGISAPVERSENDFDPGAKFHVAANVPYIRYFLAHIYQFQFHRGLCKVANMSPLHNCSIYNNTDAGAKFKAMLQLGRSLPWTQALQAATGEKTLNVDAITEYFQPLSDWLSGQNKGNKCGWTPEPSPTPEPSVPSPGAVPAPGQPSPFDDCMTSWGCGNASTNATDCSDAKRTFVETCCKMEGIMAMWIWIVVLSAGALIILLLLLCLCFCCCCRKKVTVPEDDEESINRLLDHASY